jgi:protein Mpv17
LIARFPKSLLRRVLADQLIWAPPSTTLCLLFLGSTEHNSLASGFARVRAMAPKTIALNAAVWFPVQLLNFGLVPIQHQVLFSNLVGLGWGCVLSSLANAPIK